MLRICRLASHKNNLIISDFRWAEAQRTKITAHYKLTVEKKSIKPLVIPKERSDCGNLLILSENFGALIKYYVKKITIFVVEEFSNNYG